MDDGVVLRADVFRPVKDGQYPVILTYGPYAKNLAFQDGYPSAWQRMAEKHPDVTAGSSNLYQSWEVVDPEKWVPHDYAVVRVDSRGAGCSPGVIDPFSPRETKDFYDCIEWAGVQPWSTGKVGLNGISYYATNQWYVASLQPPHLAAMCVWEGCGRFLPRHDASRRHRLHLLGELVRHAGQDRAARRSAKKAAAAACTANWCAGRRRSRKNSSPRTAPISAATSWPIRSTTNIHRDRSPVWDKVTAPLFSAANWGGQGLHPRGNFEGFVRAASKQKWLEAHGIEHWTHFYTDYGREQQLRFFDYFLHGKTDGWSKQPKVLLQVRHPGEKFVARAENEWPIARTQWTKFYLDPKSMALSTKKPSGSAKLDFAAMGEGLTFLTPALEHDTEITGPSALKLFASSSTKDADFFIVLRVFTGDLKEVVFQGAIDPHTPIAQGWLRASHRKLDKKLSLPYRPYHTHDQKQPLAKGKPVELDIEIWPTSIVVPAGYRIGLVDPRQGLRIRRRQRRQAVELQERTHRLRPVPAQPSEGPPARAFSTAPPRCISAAARRPICCCRSFRRKNRQARKRAGENRYTVMAGLVPAIHAFDFFKGIKPWMPATSAGMTNTTTSAAK